MQDLHRARGEIYFGDVSGTPRGLLQGGEEVCVVAVVAGDRQDCYRCPKRTVDHVRDISEAKWNDLTHTQKRRFFDCLSENSSDLKLGYAAFTEDDLKTVENYHKLYQDIVFPPAWDLTLRGFAYGEIVFELANDPSNASIEFDRIASQPQCEAVQDAITEFVTGIHSQFKSSRQVPGIQAADCLAGGIAEQLKGGEPWLDYLDSAEVVSCKNTALIQLEHKLTED